jgi:hypothetical protein
MSRWEVRAARSSYLDVWHGGPNPAAQAGSATRIAAVECRGASACMVSGPCSRSREPCASRASMARLAGGVPAGGARRRWWSFVGSVQSSQMLSAGACGRIRYRSEAVWAHAEVW